MAGCNTLMLILSIIALIVAIMAGVGCFFFSDISDECKSKFISALFAALSLLCIILFSMAVVFTISYFFSLFQ